jgi:hypothetical protein
MGAPLGRVGRTHKSEPGPLGDAGLMPTGDDGPALLVFDAGPSRLWAVLMFIDWGLGAKLITPGLSPRQK